MARLGDMFPSKYLKADDCDPDLVLTMSEVKMETVGQGDEADYKPVLHFHETEKGLVLNKTNSTSIAKLYGDETDAWEGKKVALFATEVDFQGKQVMAIRVRLKAPKGKPAPATTAAATATTPRPPGPGPELTTRPADDGDNIDDDSIPF